MNLYYINLYGNIKENILIFCRHAIDIKHIRIFLLKILVARSYICTPGDACA